jgi:hypothetical protein
LICMHLGTVLSEGPPAAVLSDPAVLASYLGQADVARRRFGRPAPRRVAATTRRSSSE